MLRHTNFPLQVFCHQTCPLQLSKLIKPNLLLHRTICNKVSLNYLTNSNKTKFASKHSLINSSKPLHFQSSQMRYNRLATELSPYLLQHSHNPVDWYPWGDEAFEVANKLDKPVFLSIGYATCHWCHVMEKESFNDDVIAAKMNNAFVCVKVDREERGDIDNIYMSVCRMMNQSGGWPLTIIMTPNKEAFFAATYIPPNDIQGRIGMSTLIDKISDAWKNRRCDLVESATALTEALKREAEDEKKVAKGLRDRNIKKNDFLNIDNPTENTCLIGNSDIVDKGFREIMQSYDVQHGGFGVQPKFPTPYKLLFLLRYGGKNVCPGLKAVEHTLQQMRMGGIYDQIGFGLHRYSTDGKWLVPHFEKMLYDQALLIYACAETFQVAHKDIYANMAKEVCTYVIRDMTCSKTGGFFSAEDADSEGDEGLFYIWSKIEMESALESLETWHPDERAKLVDFALEKWCIKDSGNFMDEATRKLNGKNIPHLQMMPTEDELKTLEVARKKLYTEREKRVHPLKDNKILTDWNGLMIGALAKAGRVFRNEDFVGAAMRAVHFISTDMAMEGNDNCRLWHRYCNGHKAVPGGLNDYVFMTHGVLELYATTYDVQYLKLALKWNEVVMKFFKDEAGGYFMTDSEVAEKLIVRPKEVHDGAIPSGNSLHLLNLLRLHRLSGDPIFAKEAQHVWKLYDGLIDMFPSNYVQALLAVEFVNSSDRKLGTRHQLRESVDVVVVGDGDAEETKNMLDFFSHNLYNPSLVVVFKDTSDVWASDELAKIAPYTAEMSAVGGNTTAYVCADNICQKPIIDMESLKILFNNRNGV